MTVKGIVHCKEQPYDVYIGRANGNLPKSKWGNPFIVGVDCERGECIQMYEDWIITQEELMNSLHELEGKVLGCWCKKRSTPNKKCHGDVLAKLVMMRGLVEY
jgi:hypothetical protein